MLLQRDTRNPLKGWQVDRASIRTLGHDLQRPECVLAEPDGTVWTADARGGVVRLGPDGSQRLLLPTRPAGAAEAGQSFADRYVQAQGSLPNGLCFTPEGDFIIANWGTDALELLTRAGELHTLCTDIDGQPLGKANFPLRDSKGRIWFSVTTREQPWSDQINSRVTDGYVAVLDERGVRVAAEGFCGTNEIRLDPAEKWLYVVESTAWRISRLPLRPDGTLGPRETYGPERLPGFPDGFAFDSFGNLWITLIFTDQLIALTPDGELLTLLDDSNPATRQRLVAAYDTRAVTPELLAATHGTVAPWLASLSFGGSGLRTVYLGSLRGSTVPYFQSPVAGQPMIHWREPRAITA